jgi:hypothetical protein
MVTDLAAETIELEKSKDKVKVLQEKLQACEAGRAETSDTETGIEAGSEKLFDADSVDSNSPRSDGSSIVPEDYRDAPTGSTKAGFVGRFFGFAGAALAGTPDQSPTEQSPAKSAAKSANKTFHRDASCVVLPVDDMLYSLAEYTDPDERIRRLCGRSGTLQYIFQPQVLLTPASFDQRLTAYMRGCPEAYIPQTPTAKKGTTLKTHRNIIENNLKVLQGIDHNIGLVYFQHIASLHISLVYCLTVSEFGPFAKYRVKNSKLLLPDEWTRTVIDGIGNIFDADVHDFYDAADILYTFTQSDDCKQAKKQHIELLRAEAKAADIGHVAAAGASSTVDLTDVDLTSSDSDSDSAF